MRPFPCRRLGLNDDAVLVKPGFLYPLSTAEFTPQVPADVDGDVEVLLAIWRV